MRAVPKLMARSLLLAAAQEGERLVQSATTKEGLPLAPMRKRAAVIHVCIAIGHDRLGLPVMVLARLFRRSHSVVVRAVREMPGRLSREPWESLHRDLSAFVESRLATGAGAEMEPRPIEEEEVRGEGGAAADADDDDVWLGREWWDKNDRRFVTRMRQVHPEREVAIRRAGA